MWLYNQTPRGCHRKTDRSRRRQRLICKGYDLDGNRETGEAGSGDDVDVVTKVSPADSTSLEDMATELLSKVSDANLGASITVPVATGAHFKKGDTIPVHIDRLAMDGFFRIKKTNKQSALVTWTLEKTQTEITAVLNAMKENKTEDLASRAGVRFTRSDTEPTSPRAGDMWYAPTANLYKWYNGAGWTQFAPV